MSSVFALRSRWRRLADMSADDGEPSGHAGFMDAIRAIGPRRTGRVLDIAEKVASSGFMSTDHIENRPVETLGRGPGGWDAEGCGHLIHVVMGCDRCIQGDVPMHDDRLRHSGLAALDGCTFDWTADMLEAFLAALADSGNAGRAATLTPPDCEAGLGFLLSMSLNRMMESAGWNRMVHGDAEAFGAALAAAWTEALDIGGCCLAADAFPSMDRYLRWRRIVESGAEVPTCAATIHSMECLTGDGGVASCDDVLAALAPGLSPDYSAVTATLDTRPFTSVGIGRGVMTGDGGWSEEEDALLNAITWDVAAMAERADTPECMLGVLRTIDLMTMLSRCPDLTEDCFEPRTISVRRLRPASIPFVADAIRVRSRDPIVDDHRIVMSDGRPLECADDGRDIPIHRLPSDALAEAVGMLAAGLPADMMAEMPGLHR